MPSARTRKQSSLFVQEDTHEPDIKSVINKRSGEAVAAQEIITIDDDDAAETAATRRTASATQTPAAANDPDDVILVTLESLRQEVECKKIVIFEALRQGLAQIYWDASKTFDRSNDSADRRHRNKLQMYAIAIRTRSMGYILEWAPKEWSKLLERAREILDDHWKDIEHLPKMAKNKAEEKKFKTMKNERAVKYDTVIDPIDKHAEVLKDFEKHLK